MKNNKAAFTLLEVLVASAIAILVMTALLGPIQRMLEMQRWMEEKNATSAIADQLADSCNNATPAQNVTVSGIYPWGGASTYNTNFSENLGNLTDLFYAGSITYNSLSWYAKLGAMRGMTATNGTVFTETADSDIRRIAVNTWGLQRFLLAGPNEAGVQRYLLISVAAPVSRGLVWPAHDATATYFNEIWSGTWGGENSAVPAGWSARLTSGQLAQWNLYYRGKTNAGRVLVHRITVRKYRMTVNNNHLTNSAWVDWDGVNNRMTALPSSGASVSAVEILAGRGIVVRQGVAAPGIEVMRFPIKENTAVTVQ